MRLYAGEGRRRLFKLSRRETGETGGAVVINSGPLLIAKVGRFLLCGEEVPLTFPVWGETGGQVDFPRFDSTLYLAGGDSGSFGHDPMYRIVPDKQALLCIIENEWKPFYL